MDSFGASGCASASQTTVTSVSRRIESSELSLPSMMFVISVVAPSFTIHASYPAVSESMNRLE